MNNIDKVAACPKHLLCIEGSAPALQVFIKLVSLVNGAIPIEDISDPENDVVLFDITMFYFVDGRDDDALTCANRRIITNGVVYWDLEIEYPFRAMDAYEPVPDKGIVQRAIKGFLKDLDYEQIPAIG